MSALFKFSNWFGKKKSPDETVNENRIELNALLLEAAAANQVTKVKELLEAGADVNCQTNDGWTPLLKAAVHNSELTTLLLEREADPNIASVHGYTPLHRAAGHGNQMVVLELLDAEPDINAKDEYGQSAWRIALHEGHEDLADLLAFRQHNEAVEAGKHRVLLEGNFKGLFYFATPSREDYHYVTVTFEDGTKLNNAKVYQKSDLELPPEYMQKKIKVLSINLDQP